MFYHVFLASGQDVNAEKDEDENLFSGLLGYVQTLVFQNTAGYFLVGLANYQCMKPLVVYSKVLSLIAQLSP